MITTRLLAIAMLLASTLPFFAAHAGEAALRAGNKLNIQFSGIPPEDALGMNKIYTIDDRGRISGLNYLNEDIVAAGLKPSDLQRKIVDLYRAKEIYTQHSVTISLDTNGTERIVTVGGAVSKSGAIPFRDDMTVGEAVDTAQPTPFGDLKRVKLIRAGAEYVLDLRKAGGQPAGTKLEPGDRLVVPKD